MVRPEHLAAFHVIYERLNCLRIDWAITGSLGMALQGMQLDVHDIDLQTDAPGAYALESCLAEYVVQPVRFFESERMSSHFDILEIKGIRLEIMDDIQKRLPNAPWEAPVELERHKRWIQWQEMRLPVLSLE
jgi:hypothetical protein